MKQLLLVTTGLFLACANLVEATEHVWIEGEAFTHAPQSLQQAVGVEAVENGVGYNVTGWGNTQMISEAQLLHVSMTAKQIDAYLPDEGLVFGYDFTVADSGERHIWARIGYEFVRSEFEWRLDGGLWQRVSSRTPTVNPQPIQTWNELGWLKLGSARMRPGEHTIEFRHQRYQVQQGGKSATARFLFMLDCLCITTDEFRPSGKWRPGIDHQSVDDRAAAKQVFLVNQQAGPDGRAWTPLDGLWQYAPWSETSFPIAEDSRLQPVQELPDSDNLRWFAYRAPGDRDSQMPEQAFTHRYLLRTRIDVPAALDGRGFFLDVQRSNLIISVFVNGKFVGGTDTFHTAWQMDLTEQIQPGSVNELTLVVKDAYYSLNPQDDPAAEGMGTRRYWNIPRGFLTDNQGVAGRHDMPVASDCRNGILEPASFVVCGPIYTADVFAKPSVKQRALGLELTVHNPGAAATVQVSNEIIPWNQGQGGKVELRFPPQTLKLGNQASETLDIQASWSDPTLWWPDAPHLYWVKTTISSDGRVVDVRRTRFGFREWDWSTHMFRLNGIKWPMWADLSVNGKDPHTQVETAKISHQNHMRYWQSGGLGPMTRRQALDYFDQTGMLVRSSGTFDGQRANYGGGLSEPDKSAPADDRGRFPRKAKTRLFDNWRKQMTAWIKEERNHPSIFIWSVENEITYINANNLGQAAQVEPAIRDSVFHVMKIDPTRPAMVDGGNALRDESLPVNGAHYTEFMNAEFRDFPDAAYSRDHYYDPDRPQRGAWRLVPDRPIMGGEIYFANGYSTDRFATVGGDRCFIGMGETMQARGLWGKMLSEGYRWCEYAAFQFWMGNADYQYWNSWSPVAVFCRQWNWTWGAGSRVDRTLKVFNNTRFDDAIEVSWRLELEGKPVADGRQVFEIAPGEAEQFDISFQVPDLQSAQTGSFSLQAERGGKTVFRDAKPVHILIPARLAPPRLSQEQLAVFDPLGTVSGYLFQRGIAFTPVSEYGEIPSQAEVVIVGSDAVPADRSRDSIWLSLAAAGKKIIVLDQRHPLCYQAIPGDLTPTQYTGRFGFSEDLTHPIFSGLVQDDFFTWGNDHVMYRNAYRKGTKGGRSLLQCDNGLAYTALFESQINDGLFIISQLEIGSKLAKEGVAQQIFQNMLTYAADYVPVRMETTSIFPPGDARSALLESLNLQQNPAELSSAFGRDGIVIVDASAANLKTLAAHKADIDAFCERGGWLMLWGLSPDGLQDFNALVQHQHVLRKFDRERVLLSYPQDRLAAGLTLRDVVMDTGQKMYGWMALKEPDRDAFDWLVDHTNIAPFCTFPKPTELGKSSDSDPGVDHWPRNMVNGFTSDDNWAFTFTINMDLQHKNRFTLKLPKEEELVALKLRPSKLYHPITRLNIYFDDDPEPVSAQVPVRDNPVTEEIPLQGRKARNVTIEVAEWAERGTKNIVVIDNLWLQVRRSDEYMKNVRSLLNIGALMKYQKGQGGILLNQLRLVPSELNPDNAAKKASIVKTLLKNMGAIFQGTRTKVTHTVYSFTPVQIDDSQFNAFTHQRGQPQWFAGGDISAIPVGRRQFAGVDFLLSDFSTSPVPSVFMLRGSGNRVRDDEITGIEIGAKADVLCFLHTFHASNQIENWRRRVRDARQRNQQVPEPPHLATYVIHHQDGSRQEAKVLFEQHVGIWNSEQPQPLPEADLAWVGQQPNGDSAAVWMMKWTNPQPDKLITSIDFRRAGNTGLGAPALFAVSVGNVEEPDAKGR